MMHEIMEARASAALVRADIEESSVLMIPHLRLERPTVMSMSRVANWPTFRALGPIFWIL